MAKTQVYNVECHPLRIGHGVTVLAGKGTLVDEQLAEQLCAGPSWSYDNPRRVPDQIRVRKPRVEKLVALAPADELAAADMIGEGSPVREAMRHLDDNSENTE